MRAGCLPSNACRKVVESFEGRLSVGQDRGRKSQEDEPGRKVHEIITPGTPCRPNSPSAHRQREANGSQQRAERRQQERARH